MDMDQASEQLQTLLRVAIAELRREIDARRMPYAKVRNDGQPQPASVFVATEGFAEGLAEGVKGPPAEPSARRTK